MAKQRIHNEWFQPLIRGHCYCDNRQGQAWSWGEYVNGRWRTVTHFCQGCFAERVLTRLIAHAGPCGCAFKLNARSGHGPLPDWIQAAEAQCNVSLTHSSTAGA